VWAISSIYLDGSVNACLLKFVSLHDLLKGVSMCQNTGEKLRKPLDINSMAWIVEVCPFSRDALTIVLLNRHFPNIRL